MDSKLQKLTAEFRDIEARLSQGGLSAADLKELSRRHAEFSPLAARVKELERLEGELRDLESLLAGSDAEMRSMAAAEKPQVAEKIRSLEDALRLELVPKDPTDARNVFLEIRAGAGGEEAALPVCRVEHGDRRRYGRNVCLQPRYRYPEPRWWTERPHRGWARGVGGG